MESPGASVREIIAKNVFTYFNFLFFLLAGCVIAVRQWLNLTFLGPVFCNMFIGIVQDLRVKKKVDGLKIMAAPKCRAVRDGQIVELDAAQLVRDDIAVFPPATRSRRTPSLRRVNAASTRRSSPARPMRSSKSRASGCSPAALSCPAAAAHG